MNDIVRQGLDHLAHDVAELTKQVKPRLRGWLHLVNAPLTLAAGVVLIVGVDVTVSREALAGDGLAVLGAICAGGYVLAGARARQRGA